MTIVAIPLLTYFLLIDVNPDRPADLISAANWVQLRDALELSPAVSFPLALLAALAAQASCYMFCATRNALRKIADEDRWIQLFRRKCEVGSGWILKKSGSYFREER